MALIETEIVLFTYFWLLKRIVNAIVNVSFGHPRHLTRAAVKITYYWNFVNISFNHEDIMIWQHQELMGNTADIHDKENDSLKVFKTSTDKVETRLIMNIYGNCIL